MKKFLIAFLLLITMSGVRAQNTEPGSPFVTVHGQQLFLNGINLAWINFAHDLSDFNEPEFVKVLDQVAAAKGNVLRWWLHTDGSASPVYGADGKVTGLGDHDIEHLQRAAELAYERGILLQPTLWSHDMMNDKQGIPTADNKKMIEDPEYTQAYITNALIPLVTALKGNPDIVAWEIFNEPEGVTKQFGWTDERTDMPHIQQFVNLLAGAIYRADPDALVTDGSWNMQALTDVGGMTNFYSDERLIAAGGDKDGTLDFYEVHYYPQYFDEKTSPFHNAFSHWELDKPLVVAEFPAKAIADLGAGYKPKTQLTSTEAYQYLYNNGYAGAMAWTFYASDFGQMSDVAPAIESVSALSPEHTQVDMGSVDHIPLVQKPIDNPIVPLTTTTMGSFVDLNTVFHDAEDAKLTFTVTQNSKPELVKPVISDAGVLSLDFPTGAAGLSSLEVTATDPAGHTSSAQFVVQVVDPDRGNVALGKSVNASSIESESYPANFAVDGLDTTRWSTKYADGQWLDVDLGRAFTISEVTLKWEAAFGANYDIQVWDGSAWKTVYSEAKGDGKLDDITLDTPVDARYVRMNGIKRGTEWGFSLFEFQIDGEVAQNADAALETQPDETIAAPAEPTPQAAAASGTLLNSFETDVEGWQVVKDWAGGKAVTTSTDQADEGKQALALQATYTGGGTWQEAGVAFDPQGGADWTGATQLTMDVFVPQGAADFIAQVFTKTGADWTWANSADNPLTPGKWTTVSADLSKMGDLTTVNEFGVKIGTSSTAFDGQILIDNVRLSG